MNSQKTKPIDHYLMVPARKIGDLPCRMMDWVFYGFYYLFSKSMTSYYGFYETFLSPLRSLCYSYYYQPMNLVIQEMLSFVYHYMKSYSLLYHAIYPTVIGNILRCNMSSSREKDILFQRFYVLSVESYFY